jgi:hypothetical protein
MEEKIKATSRQLMIAYALFWMVPLCLVILGEDGGDWVGAYVGNVRITYISETILILLTAACVPLALKLYALVLTRRIDRASIEQALHLYLLGGLVRLLLLSLPLWMGIWTYYFLFSTKGILCGAIVLIASLFCVPSEARLRRELHIEREESDGEEKIKQ